MEQHNEDYYFVTKEVLTEEQFLLDAMDDGLFLKGDDMTNKEYNEEELRGAYMDDYINGGEPLEVKPRTKKKPLWTLSDEPQGRVRKFGEGSTAGYCDEVAGK